MCLFCKNQVVQIKVVVWVPSWTGQGLEPMRGYDGVGLCIYACICFWNMLKGIVAI